MSVQKAANHYMIRSYGNLLLADTPSFDEKTGTWTVPLKTDYPRIIQDDRSEERTLKLITIKGRGTLRFSQDLKPDDRSFQKLCLWTMLE